MIFIFATELEAQRFRAAAPHAQIEICGVGAAECAAKTAAIISTMRASGTPQRLILAGIAGSYSLCEVALCEVVEVIEERIESLPDRFQKRYCTPPLTPLRKVVSNSVNSSSEAEGCVAQIENMEGAAFVAMCQEFGVECCQIRAISNKVAEPFERWAVAQACEALSEALIKHLVL